jgi:hypothetical protein
MAHAAHSDAALLPAAAGHWFITLCAIFRAPRGKSHTKGKS